MNKHTVAFAIAATTAVLTGCTSTTKTPGSTAAPLTAVTPSSAAATPGAPSTATLTGEAVNSLEGTWRSDGYGYLIAVRSGIATLYQTTKVSCFADPIRTQQGAAATDGSITFSILESTTAAFRSKTADTAGLVQDGSIGEVIFNRIDRLPKQCDTPAKADPVAAFDTFVNTYLEQYPFFEQRKIDWSSVGDTFRKKVSPTTTDEQLVAIFSDMIRPLNDAHTVIGLGEKPVFEGPLRKDSTLPKGEEMGPYAERVAVAEQKYLGIDLKTWADNYIAYGDLPDGVGYLRVAAFSGYSASGSSVDDQAELTKALDEIFTTDRVAKLKGLIIDVRLNVGGSDELALQLAGRLTDTTYIAYAKQARNDPTDPKKFTVPQTFSVKPGSGPKFVGPIAILTSSLTISAGETFTQAMLGRSPTPIRLGGNTQGVYSDVLVRNLPGSSVLVGLPNEKFVTQEGFSFDGTGIPPDICIPTFTEADLTASKDPAADKARELLLTGAAHATVDITKPPATIC
jgi:hypothetical protein